MAPSAKNDFQSLTPRVDDEDGGSKSFVLQSDTWYNEQGFVPENFVTDHCKYKLPSPSINKDYVLKLAGSPVLGVPKESIDLLSKLPGVETLEITAKYPTAVGKLASCNTFYTAFEADVI